MINDSQILNSKILIVDDEPANIKLLEQLLKQLGYAAIKSTTDSREVIDYYTEFQPDLILLDLKMPHLDGVQVIEKLKQAGNENRASVMVITAQKNHTNRLRVLEAGAGNFLGKPFDVLEVSVRIKNMLKLSLLNKMYDKNNQLLEKKISDLTDDLKSANDKLKEETTKRKKLEKILETNNKNLENEVEEIKSLLISGHKEEHF